MFTILRLHQRSKVVETLESAELVSGGMVFAAQPRIDGLCNKTSYETN
jgi:hypothetical protein